MPTKARVTLSTNVKGLGWRHRHARDTLLRNHADGSPCKWCGRPMYRDRTRNWDYKPASTNPTSGTLHADHSDISRSEALRLGVPIPPPNRLLHGVCNIQRGDGGNDHLAVATVTNTPTAKLLMAWPWVT